MTKQEEIEELFRELAIAEKWSDFHKDLQMAYDRLKTLVPEALREREKATWEKAIGIAERKTYVLSEEIADALRAESEKGTP